MESVFLKIYWGNSRHGKLAVDGDGVQEYKSNELAIGVKPTRRKYRMKIDGVVLHCFLQSLKSCEGCRQRLIRHLLGCNSINTIKFVILPTTIDTIDHNWNSKITILVRERCELDHILSWLSTLGGAFSALGDYFGHMAETAGQISMQQLKLALHLGDPTLVSRCRLYFSLSLIQKRRFRLARDIIRDEYDRAVRDRVRDDRLINMCHGIWAKLQYEKKMYKCRNK